MKKVAISQSNYIPWRGYFDLISLVDEFIIYDEVQYTRRDWRNRNKIKTKNGAIWLTVPVKAKGKYYQKIRDTEIDGSSWKEIHWKTIKANYSRAPFFKNFAEKIENIYLFEEFTHLSKLNRRLISEICCYLKIKTKIRDSFEFKLAEDRNERLLRICKDTNASEYISGPSAKNYIDEKIFINNNIKLTFADYSNYGEYNQLWGLFENNLSILDLIFNYGEDTYKHMKYLKQYSSYNIG